MSWRLPLRGEGVGHVGVHPLLRDRVLMMIAPLGSRTLQVSWRFVQGSLPVLLDVAGFTAIVVGVWLLAGAWEWIVAGGLLILSGLRAQGEGPS